MTKARARTKPWPRRRAAIHEAGHAVASLVFRTGVRRVDIRRSADGLEGLTSYTRPSGNSTRRDVLERQGMTTLGGIAAEWIDAGKPKDAQFGGPDVFRGLDFAIRLEGDDPTHDDTLERANARYVQLLDRTVATLEVRWGAVQAVAAALIAEEAFDRGRLLTVAGKGI